MKKLVGTIVTLAILAAPFPVFAQGPSRIDQKEQKRIEEYDKPIQPDPIGNALIGGLATASLKGAAAGAASMIRSTAAGVSVQKGQQKLKK